MSNQSVLITRSVPGALRERLEANFSVRSYDSEQPPARPELFAMVTGQRGIVTMVSDLVDDQLLEAAGPALAVVANYAVGYDNIDVEAATRRGVVVCNTPGVLSEATAELTIALLLALERRVVEGDRHLQDRAEWAWAPTWMLGRGLRGLRLGIIGLGRIGREVAKLAEAHGMAIAYARPSGPLEVPYLHLPLDELLETSDVVSVHCPLTDETRHLIGADELRRMRADAVIVNTARGAVIDEKALASAVQTGEIAGAALDVYENEPAICEGLRGHPKVVLCPHLGSSTWATRNAMERLAAEAVEAVLLEGRPPANALNPHVLAASC